MLDKQDQMLGKQDRTIEIIREGNEKLCSNMDEFHQDTIRRFDKLDNTLDKSFSSLDNSFHSFHHDTIQRFDTVDVKYGKIAENMEKILNEMKEEREKSGSSTEKLINAILKLAEK